MVAAAAPTLPTAAAPMAVISIIVIPAHVPPRTAAYTQVHRLMHTGFGLESHEG